MSAGQDHSDVHDAALKNARRLEDQLRRHREELAAKRPADSQGGEALRDAALAIDRIVNILGGSARPESSSKSQES
ncbi:MAG TPA: hypothetical protein VLJ39_18795 [Tepidisphaeraceae bacterium]|nr:hypothetical protein [Tepidisphaeraceae bacterium]